MRFAERLAAAGVSLSFIHKFQTPDCHKKRALRN